MKFAWGPLGGTGDLPYLYAVQKYRFRLRYFIQLAFFGAAYHGWQRQPNALSVQEVLEDCLSKLLKQPVEVVGAGRTDAGVHARMMIAHVEVEHTVQTNDVVRRLNAFLPSDIAVQDMRAVNPNAHARFDATSRSYEYWVAPHKNPFYKDTAHYCKHPLDLGRMNEAAGLLLGHRDFECFSKSHTDVKTFYCDVQEAHWSVEGDLLVFRITADRFLRNMVRAVVGTLLEVGKQTYAPVHVKTILKSKDRSKAGASVPAKGLYLTSIVYPNTVYFNG